jgi:hypothetical protein
MLHDRIFPEQGQLRSESTVYIDGRYVGNLNVDLDNPVTTLSVTVPRPGNYTYYIVDKILKVRPDGGTWVLEAKGGGTINVANGKSFTPVLNSSQATVSLR